MGTRVEHAAGAPYTRFTEGLVRCTTGGACAWERAPRLEAAGAERGPAGARLDLSLRATHVVARRTVDLLAGLENVGALAPDGAYLGTAGRCPAGGEVPCEPHVAPASYEDVRLPAVGPRASVALRIGL